jgi:uncharacterized protein (DUF1810 family)
MPVVDSFNLGRFIAAQHQIFEAALHELRAGRKQSHWMWFIFPQLRGLGHSPRAILYSIGSLEEARAYLAHPVLGSRLLLCTQAVLAIEGRTLHEVFGSPDDAKFCSCMTLFAQATERDTGKPFRAALDRYCDGRMDPQTMVLLNSAK